MNSFVHQYNLSKFHQYAYFGLIRNFSVGCKIPDLQETTSNNKNSNPRQEEYVIKSKNLINNTITSLHLSIDSSKLDNLLWAKIN